MKSYTVQYKVEAVNYFRNGHNLCESAREFKVNRKQIRLWDREYDRLLVASLGTEKNKKKLHCGGRIVSDELDACVFEWYNFESRSGKIIRNWEIQEKARNIGINLGFIGFKASLVWIWRWKRRFDIPTDLRRMLNAENKRNVMPPK